MESNNVILRTMSPAMKTETPDEIKQLNQKVMQFGESHIQNVWERRLAVYEMKEDKAAGLMNYRIEEEPKDIDTLLKVIEEQVLGNGVKSSCSANFGHVPGGGLYSAALGDYIAAVTNAFAGLFAVSAGAVRMENMLISWVANLIGYPAGHAGNLTSGGSAGTLLAVVAARHSRGVKGRDFDRLVVYMTESGHICHQKVLNTAGLFEAIIRKVPIDENFRMKVDKLRTLIHDDKKAGLLPFMIVGTLGTTDVGSIDPIDQIADVAEEYNLWFHVDAAYGGFFVLVDEYKPYFKGVNRADSIIIDPHKGLFLPYGTGMVIVRRGYILRNANTDHKDAPCLLDHGPSAEEESPNNLSFELTKHFRGMRMWLPLQLHGVKTFRKCLEENVQLTRYLYAKLSELPGIVVGRYPQLTVITFHYETGKEERNEIINKMLFKKIGEDGSVSLSSTVIHGKFRLRVCVLHYRCIQDSVDLFLAVLREKIKDLKV